MLGTVLGVLTPAGAVVTWLALTYRYRLSKRKLVVEVVKRLKVDDIADSSAIALTPAPRRPRFVVRASRQLAAAGVLTATWVSLCVCVFQCMGFCTFILGVLGACLVLCGLFNQNCCESIKPAGACRCAHGQAACLGCHRVLDWCTGSCISLLGVRIHGPFGFCEYVMCCRVHPCALLMHTLLPCPCLPGRCVHLCCC